MKMIIQIKLKPSEEQKVSLMNTIKEANNCSNEISKYAFENRLFNQFKLHGVFYHKIKESSKLSAQMIVRCISNVANSYKAEKKRLHFFKETSAITYDCRILSYNIVKKEASIWTVDGRFKILFVAYPEKYLFFMKGEADLIYRKGKFYLFQTCEIPEDTIEDVNEFIGIDLGLVEIATLDNGTKFSSEALNKYREKRQRIRSSIDSKGTRNCNKLLKRLSGKERTHTKMINHIISKAIVSLAKSEHKGIALEELKNIRFTASDKGKKIRTRLGKWQFSQLRSYIEYKAKKAGIPVAVIRPDYTSQTCSKCHCIGKRNGKSFKCEKCGVEFDADVNAAKNIALLGRLVSTPEKYNSFNCALHSFAC